MVTKRDIIGAAYEAIGIADYDFDLQPEEYQIGLRKLDGMLALWALSGIRIGYAGTSDGPDVDANIPQWAYEALYLNLAVRIAPGFGKVPSQEVKSQALTAYNAILGRCTSPIPRTGASYAGSGNWCGNIVLPEEPIRTHDGNLDIIGG